MSWPAIASSWDVGVAIEPNNPVRFFPSNAVLLDPNQTGIQPFWCAATDSKEVPNLLEECDAPKNVLDVFETCCDLRKTAGAPLLRGDCV